MRWLRVIAVTATLLLLADIAWPMPIPPQTLRMLNQDSELIVTARVATVTRFEVSDGFENAKAELHILQVIKGAVGGSIVEVIYPANLVCPEPPRYKEGTTVLAFLSPRKDGIGYTTVGLSYGAKRLSASAVNLYTTRLRELAEIEQQSDKAERQRQLFEWFVRCAEEPATRWEGAYEFLHSRQVKQLEEESRKKVKETGLGLSVPADREAEGSETKQAEEETVDFIKLLTEEQRKRLATALYRSVSLSDGGMELIEVVESWQDENLLPFMWSYLKAFKKDYPWDTKSLMRKVATALNNQEALQLIEPFEASIFNDAEKEAVRAKEQRAIWEKFIEAIERAEPPGTIEIRTELPTPPDPAAPTQVVKRFNSKVAIIAVTVLALLSTAVLSFKLI